MAEIRPRDEGAASGAMIGESAGPDRPSSSDVARQRDGESEQQQQARGQEGAQDGQEALARPQGELFFLKLNPEKTTTVVLLHGLLSSHLEYAHVASHLTDFHLLIPDLPGHSRSAGGALPSSTSSAPGSLTQQRGAPPPTDVTIPAQAACIARLIRTHAHGGKAHLVGLSMGGYVATTLALTEPDLVLSLFITGAAPLRGVTHWMAANPTAVWCVMSVLLRWMPDWLYWWAAEGRGLKRHEELLAEMRANMRWENVGTVYPSIVRTTVDDVAGLRVRTLVVAGGLDDDVGAAKVMGDRLTVEGSKAAVVKEAAHAWDLQFPELFAQGVKFWIEGRELPEKFVIL